MVNRFISLLCVSVSRHCNFGEILDDNLRDQIIEKLPDLELKRKLLETRNITLSQVLEKARASEAAGHQVEHMAGATDVNAVGKREDKTYDRSGKTCFSRGKAGHFSRDPCCPARGKKCSNCSMYGHFAVCCQGLNRITADKRGESRFKKPSAIPGNSNGRQIKWKIMWRAAVGKEKTPPLRFL